MSSIVTGILSSTVGLLANKARDLTAAKLKEGDVTDAKIRQMIVRRKRRR
jgi:L-cystine uptake protein TcyP (sodium:dicarboxylate symporter family)